MKRFFASLGLLFALPLGAFAADDTCAACAKAKVPMSAIEAQIRNVACETEKLAKRIHAGEEQVPSRLYHFGKKALLLQDVAQGTIPQDVWDKSIMGAGTRFELGKMRRGLYGTAGLDTNEFGGGRYGWLMEIQLKEECRAPRHVASLSHLNEDARFKTWATRKGLGREARDCYAEKMSFQGFPAGSLCEKVTLEFLKDHDIRVLQDEQAQKSFYIRDRGCIATVRGTAEELLQILLEDDFLWRPLCDGHVSKMVLDELVLNALADLKEPLPEEELERLSSKLADDEYNFPCMQAYRRCKMARTLDAYRTFIRRRSPGDLSCSEAGAVCPSHEVNE